MIKVSYDTTIDELVDEHMRLFRRVKTLRRTEIRVGLLLGLAMFLGFASLGSDPLPWRLAESALWALVSIGLYILFLKPRQRANTRRLLHEQLGTSGPIPFEVELTDSQIRTTQAGIETAVNWPSLESIEESTDAIRFWFIHKGLVTVRNGAFASAQEREEFVSFARGCMAETPSSEGAAADKPPGAPDLR